jgi:hypothetical protein
MLEKTADVPHVDEELHNPLRTKEKIYQRRSRGHNWAELLIDIFRTGNLDGFLSLLSLAVLEILHDILIPEPESNPENSIEPVDNAIFAFLQKTVPEELIQSDDRAARLRNRLKSAVVATDTFSMPPDSAQIITALNKIFPLETNAMDPATEYIYLRPIPSEPRGSPTHIRHADKAVAAQETDISNPAPQQIIQTSELFKSIEDADVYVESALPFLLLGPLSKIGYLEAVEAVFDSAGKLDDFAAFATALAFKVLEPPERGWHYKPSTRKAARVFAGVTDDVPNSVLANLSYSLAGFTPLLDAVIAQSLIEGGDASAPLILCKTRDSGGEGLILVDAEGLFPIGWKAAMEELIPLIKKCSRKAVLIPQDNAHPDLFALLDQHQINFITDAPPTRHENWRLLRSLEFRKRWTNDLETHDEILNRLAAEMDILSDDVNSIWKSIAIERSGVALYKNHAMDRSLSLAATLALGTIAWILWREQERVNPLLALYRFGDIDARVRFTSQKIQIRLPLGRRYLDLSDQGLLADIPHVPWFAARKIEFSGG